MSECVDVLGTPLAPGDKVIWHMGDSLLKKGGVYTVDKIASKPGKIAFVGVGDEYYSIYCIRIPSHVTGGQLNYEKIADCLIGLINSQPRSPRKDQIIEVLKNATS